MHKRCECVLLLRVHFPVVEFLIHTNAANHFFFSRLFVLMMMMIFCCFFFIVVVRWIFLSNFSSRIEIGVVVGFNRTEYVYGMCMWLCCCIYGFSCLTLVALPILANPMVQIQTKTNTHAHVNT